MSLKSININIHSCDECVNFKSERDYTSDSFEYCTKWICKLNDKHIRRYVDWNDNSKFIPDWCPLSNKKNKK